MPSIEIGDGGISIWYKTNTTSGDVTDFDPTKPSIVLMHPLFLHHRWMFAQMGDPVLSAKYNMISFDARSCGKTVNEPSTVHDTWVEAADLAFLFEQLGLPACHIFAAENMSVNTALRFAILFPEKCVSLTLCNIATPHDPEWAVKAYGDIMQLMAFPNDLLSVEEANMEMAALFFNQDIPAPMLDEIVEYWQVDYPATNRCKLYDLGQVIFNRIPLTAEQLASINHPVLIMHGDKSPVHPVSCAEELRDQLVNSPEPGLYIVRGAPESMTLLPAYAPRVNKTFIQFLSHHPSTKPTAWPPPKSAAKARARMSVALTKLAQVMGDSSIASRDPSSPLSFCCYPPEVRQANAQMLAAFAHDAESAFSSRGKDGKPLRAFSERHHAEWYGEGGETQSRMRADTPGTPGVKTINIATIEAC